MVNRGEGYARVCIRRRVGQGRYREKGRSGYA